MNNQILLNGITIEQLAEALKVLMFEKAPEKMNAEKKCAINKR